MNIRPAQLAIFALAMIFFGVLALPQPRQLAYLEAQGDDLFRTIARFEHAVERRPLDFESHRLLAYHLSEATSFDSAERLLDKDIFLTGALIEGMPNEATKMVFNPANNCFDGLLFLKQGYYDYQYIVKENGELADSILLTEGSHYETNNEYSIFVYYRDPGSIYDQLIGFEKIIGPNN